MPRAKTHESKQIALRLRLNLRGWLDFHSREHGGISAYINSLLIADRDKAMKDPETARRYRLYLEAMGLDEELASLDEHED